MSVKTKKATFNLPPAVLAALDDAMAKGAAPSKNVLVERALVKELKELKKQERKVLWKAAAKDPLLLKDIEEIEDDFKYADAESARRIK